jgi:hypothetical protein
VSDHGTDADTPTLLAIDTVHWHVCTVDESAHGLQAALPVTVHVMLPVVAVELAVSTTESDVS